MADNRSGEITSITSADLSGLLHSPLGSEIIRPFSQQIFLRHIWIVGTQYSDDPEQIVSDIQIDDRCTFLREPKNVHDEYAILVLDPKERKIGYIPRHDNRVFARLMDAGKLLYGKVSRIRDEEDQNYPYCPVQIAIYMED